jgi:hypothetical protein
MPLQLLNLRIFQGDSYHLEMSVADFDPMAGSLRAQIRDRWSNPGELYADFVVTAAAGLVILDLDEIFTSNLRATCSPAEMPEGAEAGINLTLDHLNWDLQQDLAGTVKTWRSGKVFVPGEVTLLPGTGPPPSPVDQWLTRAIADDLYQPIGGGGSGGDGAEFSRTFTQSDLSVIGLLPIVHGLNSYPSGVAVYDNFGEIVEPDTWRSLSLTATEINLESFLPIEGLWSVSITS